MTEDVTRTLAKGALAGVAATAALVGVRQALWRLESESLRERERAIREGVEETGFQKPVRALAKRAGRDLDKATEQRLGKAAAWSLGIGGVMAYAWARQRAPAVTAGRGAAFGAAVWAVEDELLMPLSGMARPPGDYPWQAHARGFAAHVAYGVAAESALRALDARGT